MPELLINIPKSLATYVEQFDDNPSKAITKLENHIINRGPDAVGYFLLAWLCYKHGDQKLAVRYALRAKTLAPGSPLIEKLHYYLTHPGHFDAWNPPVQSDEPPKNQAGGNGPEPFLDLDHLIHKLSNLESNQMTAQAGGTEQAPEDLSGIEHDVEDIASETLASIHEKQGKTEAAIRTYRRLKKLNKEKKDFYKEQITRLKQLRGEEDEENPEDD